MDFKILFWNIMKKDLSEPLAMIAEEHDVDLVILAEAPEGFDPTERLQLIDSQYGTIFNNSKKLTFHSRLAKNSVNSVMDDNESRMSILEVKIRGGSILLAALHLLSSKDSTPADRAHEATRHIRTILEYEEIFKHRRTIVVGDFNMNPFEEGMVSSHTFHAVMCKNIAQRRIRKVQSNLYRFFYNPMWNHFGDQTTGPAGSTYYNKSKPITFFWNILDQAIFRPEALAMLRDDPLIEILTTTGAGSLLTNSGLPDKKIYSDHLPLLCTLQF